MIIWLFWHRRILRKLRGGVVVVIVLLCSAPEVRTQQQKLDELAGETAAAVSQNVKYMVGAPKVLVLDFRPLHQEPGDLGSKLADQFSDSLKKQARGFVVVDRADYFARFRSVSSTVSYDRLDAADCAAEQPASKAHAQVEGLFDILPGDTVSLWVTVLNDEKNIFSKRITLPLASGLDGFESKPVAKMNETPASIVLSSADHPATDMGRVVRLSLDSDPRFKGPTCLECPNPIYSDAATIAKVQGTVKLDVEIDAAGFPVQIALIQRLRCGLTSKAIDAVAQWKFSPAVGPDGKPLVVVVPVEVTFRLY
jgi:Gram-negative bacterial TonB protein C-terminal